MIASFGGSPHLFAKLERQGGALRVRLVGPSFGEREGPIVTGMIDEDLKQDGESVRHVILDFSDIEFINSSGLGSCVTIHRNAAAEKRKVALYGLAPPIFDVFKMTHLHKLFKVVDDEKSLQKLVS